MKNTLIFYDNFQDMIGTLHLNGFSYPEQYQFVGERNNLIWKPLNAYWNLPPNLSPDIDDAELFKKYFLNTLDR